MYPGKNGLKNTGLITGTNETISPEYVEVLINYREYKRTLVNQ